MKKIKTEMQSVPKLIKSIILSDNNDTITHEYNKLICIILSPIMIILAIMVVVSHFLSLFEPTDATVFRVLIFILFGIGFEVLRRIKKRITLISHLIGLLCTVFFIYLTCRYYWLIGPSVWTLGFIMLLVSILHNRVTILSYIGVSFFISGIHIVLFDYQNITYLFPIYTVVQLVFFIIIFFVAFILHEINVKRIEKIYSKVIEANSQMTKREIAEKENKRLALYDHLTQLPNRKQFTSKLRETIEINIKDPTDLYVLFIDLDFFKSVNDTLGHSYGDELLKLAGSRFVNTVREHDIVSRIGGDEFLIMLCGAHNALVEQIAKRILHQISQPFYINENEIKITCSIGIAQYQVENSDIEVLINNADRAMYHAKEKGKNCYVVYTSKLNAQIENEKNLINDLHTALKNSEFELYYQPQLLGTSKKITGFEALIRWNHPTRGLIYPNDFISIAENNGMINNIGEWVIRTACKQNIKWQNDGIITATIAVNLSASQFTNRLFPDLIASILKDTGLEPKYLELEITESMLLGDIDLVKKQLELLRETGVSVAIDDFGTGYSSMNYLSNLPINRIKIPMDFIHGIAHNIKDESIISVILALAKSLNMDVIAEGVETKGQLDFLQDHKCEEIQGYYFARPMDVTAVEEYCKIS